MWPFLPPPYYFYTRMLQETNVGVAQALFAGGVTLAMAWSGALPHMHERD